MAHDISARHNITKIMADSDKKPVILVAEDNESNYLLVSYLLRSDYDLLWARDGVEALELYKANHIDLILMDVRMPRMGGLATTEQIRRTDTKIPIIALTAFAFDSDRAQTLDAGCTDFLSKPINAELLKSKLRKYIFGE